MSAPKLHRCRVCGCTQLDACPAGCGWEPGAGDLCTVCASAVEALKTWTENARRVNWAGLRRELSAWPRKNAI